MIPRTDLDVNALSSSQMMCGGFAGAKLRFFEQMVQNNTINMVFLLVGRGSAMLHRLPNFCRPYGTPSNASNVCRYVRHLILILQRPKTYYVHKSQGA